MRYEDPWVYRRQGTKARREGGRLQRARRLQAPASPEASAFYVQPVGASPSLGGPEVPDVLHHAPRPWGDLSGTCELVRFAYEGGDCAGVFDAVADATPLAPSSFVPDSFAPQLYLDELVDHCFPVIAEGRRYAPRRPLMIRVLSGPPQDAEDAIARQRVLEELRGHAAFRADAERLYAAVQRLREGLEAGPGSEPNVVRRKVEVLSALKESVDALSEGFEGAQSSLRRLRDAGRRMREGQAYARLAELLDLDGNLATVDLRLRLGSDGSIRDFGVLAVRRNHDNPLAPGPVRRFLQRIMAFLRGHRYGESEVVTRLLDRVFSPLVDDAVACLAVAGSLEVYLGALGFHDLARSRGLDVCLPELAEIPAPGEPSAERLLEGLFNPLLFLQEVRPRPCDLPEERHDALVVVTGPNSGGKTRLLQALALTQLLGQAGLFVPAARARIVRAPNLFVSLITEADAAQVEGHLGTELLRIRHLFEQLEPGSLAILDELCSGTNPMEGETIFEMVISLLPRLGPQVFVSTHFLGMAARLRQSPPVAQLAFLQVELGADERPTFGFVPGVARTSLAHKVAERLGVTQGELEALVERKARAHGDGRRPRSQSRAPAQASEPPPEAPGSSTAGGSSRSS
ncbi:MAG: MutS-related protein [Myxococcota bacterium]